MNIEFRIEMLFQEESDLVQTLHALLFPFFGYQRRDSDDQCFFLCNKDHYKVEYVEVNIGPWDKDWHVHTHIVSIGGSTDLPMIYWPWINTVRNVFQPIELIIESYDWRSARFTKKTYDKDRFLGESQKSFSNLHRQDRRTPFEQKIMQKRIERNRLAL